MKKLIVAACVLMFLSAPAQTLFTYAKQPVSVKEFLAAYHKNNPGKDQKAFREYLDLYIASRLKIKEARVEGLDTLPQIKSDLANLRQQILPGYLNDKESVQKLVDEAFVRSQKDIHIAHIFISFRQGTPDDISKARVKALSAENELKSGASFSDVAKKYSEDPSATTNGGDIGWITVFSLPYELENLAYSTPEGKTSAVYQSKAGFHILKNIGERRSAGRIKASEILLAYPPDATAEDKAHTKQLADSLYVRLQKGDEFGMLATKFSYDIISAASHGSMIEFGVGEYDPAFENIVYSLKEGEISKPFETSHGFHIVKLISRVSIAADKNDQKTTDALKERVEQSDRINSTKAVLAKKVLSKVSLKQAGVDQRELVAYSDSLLNYKKPGIPVHINTSTTLFSIGDKKITAADWLQYVQQNRYKADGSAQKPYSQLWDEFKEAKALQYYQDHLEDFNEDFRKQVSEFAEGNLFFEIMQRKVWSPAQTDTVALRRFYEKNKEKYVWAQSADAAIFYAADEASAKDMREHMLLTPARWRELAEQRAEKITTDSSRFEMAQIPNATKDNFKAGTITPISVNKNDNTASFAYIFKIFTQPEQRTFSEARGLVINDYQGELEKEWVAQLKKKYPVVINQQVLNDLIKKKEY